MNMFFFKPGLKRKFSGGFNGLVELYHVGVAAAEFVVRAVTADDDVSGFGVQGVD